MHSGDVIAWMISIQDKAGCQNNARQQNGKYPLIHTLRGSAIILPRIEWFAKCPLGLVAQ